MEPGYLSELCRPVSALQGRRHLRSAGHSHLDFPHVTRTRATYGRRLFAYAGPSAWNSLMI